MAKTIDELLDNFVVHIIRQDNARSSAEGNRHARRCDDSFKMLVTTYGDEGREAMTRLFTHEYPRVRCMAAAYLLRYCTDRAQAVLRELAAGRGLVSLAAECSLQNREDGSWELDLE